MTTLSQYPNQKRTKFFDRLEKKFPLWLKPFYLRSVGNADHFSSVLGVVGPETIILELGKLSFVFDLQRKWTSFSGKFLPGPKRFGNGATQIFGNLAPEI